MKIKKTQGEKTKIDKTERDKTKIDKRAAASHRRESVYEEELLGTAITDEDLKNLKSGKSDASDVAGSLSHYFTDDDLRDEMRHFEYEVAGKLLQITSNTGVFSKNRIDRASDLLIRTVEKERLASGRASGRTSGHASGDASVRRIADLGTGYGILLLSLLVLCEGAQGVGYEVSNRALRLARINAKKNGMRERVDFESGDLRKKEDSTLPFDLIVTNPPIRAGKDVVYAFYDYAFRNLAEGGDFYVVISKNQGADSSRRYLEELFGNAEVVKRESEFRVMKMTKLDKKTSQEFSIL